jgi:hypothetical protein
MDSNYICFCHNIFFGGRNSDSCCTVQEDLELYEQFLPASSRQWLEKSLACSEFCIVENLRGEEN